MQPETSFLYNSDVYKYDLKNLATYYEELMINTLKKKN